MSSGALGSSASPVAQKSCLFTAVAREESASAGGAPTGHATGSPEAVPARDGDGEGEGALLARRGPSFWWLEKPVKEVLAAQRDEIRARPGLPWAQEAVIWSTPGRSSTIEQGPEIRSYLASIGPQ